MTHVAVNVSPVVYLLLIVSLVPLIIISFDFQLVLMTALLLVLQVIIKILKIAKLVSFHAKHVHLLLLV